MSSRPVTVPAWLQLGAKADAEPEAATPEAPTPNANAADQVEHSPTEAGQQDCAAPRLHAQRFVIRASPRI